MKIQPLAAIVAGILIATPALRAQALPPITGAKRAASNAAAATNAHVHAMEGGAEQPVASTRPQRTAEGASRGTMTPPLREPSPSKASKEKSAARGRGPGSSTGVSAERENEHEISLSREAFVYNVEGRRDPFLSLLKTGELRPMVSDLRLVTVVYDPAGRSVAILRDLSTKEQYRVKVGQTLGRMRVAQIQPKSVAFTLDEFGFSRQEVLALNDTSRTR
jgi:hypothetical protein